MNSKLDIGISPCLRTTIRSYELRAFQPTVICG